MTRIDGPGYSFALPDALAGGPPVWRGWLADAPVCVIAGDRPRDGRHLRAFTTELTSGLIEPWTAPVDVPGARGALRADGLVEIELGLAADWIEWITVLVAVDGDRRFVTLTIRSRPGDELRPLHDEIAASLRLS